MSPTQIRREAYNQKAIEAVRKMQESPLSSKELDRMVDSHFKAHGMANPNKRVA